MRSGRPSYHIKAKYITFLDGDKLEYYDTNLSPKDKPLPILFTKSLTEQIPTDVIPFTIEDNEFIDFDTFNNDPPDFNLEF